MFPKLNTNRLNLREIKSKDIFAHTELFSDKETMDLFGSIPMSNDLNIKNLVETKRLEYENGMSYFWVITLNEEKEFIGFIRLMSYKSFYFDASYSTMGELKNSFEFLKYIDKDGWEIDYALLKNYRNQGIMSEALYSVLNFCNLTNITPLYAKVNDLSNKPTVRLLEKNNFKEHLQLLNLNGGYGMIYKFNF